MGGLVLFAPPGNKENCWSFVRLVGAFKRTSRSLFQAILCVLGKIYDAINPLDCTVAHDLPNEKSYYYYRSLHFKLDTILGSVFLYTLKIQLINWIKSVMQSLIVIQQKAKLKLHIPSSLSCYMVREAQASQPCSARLPYNPSRWELRGAGQGWK